MAERKLIVKIVGDSRSLEQAFSRSSRGSKNFEHDISKASRGAISAAVSFRGLGRALAFGSFQFLGGAGIVFALKSTIAAAEQSQKVVAQTANAVRASGLSWAKYGDQVQQAALAQSKLSGFDDERLLGTFSNLVRRTGDVTQAMKLNALATDVARGRNISLEAAQQIVLKASIGNIGALRRLGINISKTASAYTAITFLQRKYAGAAAAYGRTAAGAQDRFANAIQNTQEALGAALLPTLTLYLNKGADWLDNTDNQRLLQEKLATAIQNTAAAVGAIASAAQTASEAIQTLSSVLGGIDSATPSWLKDFFKKNAPPGTVIDALTGSQGVRRGLRMLHLIPPKPPSNGGNFSDADLGVKTKPDVGFRDFSFLQDLAAAQRKRSAAAIKQSNTFFDNALARLLRRGGLGDLQEQLSSIQKASALITKRIAATKDVTRKLNLEDQLLELGSQAKSIRGQISQVASERAQAQREKLKAQRDRLAEAASIRLAQRTARQFRELGLNALGETPTPGVAGLRKRLQQLAGNIAGTNLDTPKLQSQLKRFRKVLSEGLVPKDVRARIAQMMDDIAAQLQSTGLRAKLRRHASSSLILQGLGLTPEQIRAIRPRLAALGVGGTIPERSQAFAGVGGGATVLHNHIHLGNRVVADSTTTIQRKDRRRRSESRRGPYAGRN